MGFVRGTIGRAAALCACALALLLISAGPAAAQQGCGGNVPGGNSEVDQYTETVPSGCGNNNPSGGGDDGNPDAVSAGTAAELNELGGDGATALALAQANSPGGNGGDGTESSSPLSGGKDDDGGLGDVVTGAVDAAGGSDEGLGLILPLILVAVCVATGIYLGRRRAG